MTDYREQLKRIRTFPSLVKFLRDEADWPVETDDFEELTFDYEPEELGIDKANAAKIDEIKRLRPLVPNQPWGIFFVKFEPKQLPVVALRRILAGVVVKKRATASAAEQPKWVEDDLLFISNYGEGDERRISFAHFSKDPAKSDLPALRVIAWDGLDTPLHLDHTANLLVERLAWPADEDEWDDETWRERWSSAFELRHREVITTSKVLAERLAELARGIRAEILRVLEIETEDGKVTRLMKSFQESLVSDLDADAFADMYAQTIAYGLLSARIADPHGQTADDLAAHMRTNPFLRELLETFLHVGGRRGKAGGPGIDFDELGVGDVVALLDDANMEAVVRDFGDRNPLEDPVIHFYEHFLSEYDKKLKIQRGVFYTPQPVVSYIVRSVHEVLQTEFGLADGLADTTTWGEMLEQHPGLELPPLTDDPEETRTISPGEPFVQILDPATGTATFLVEVIDVVHRTLAAKWAQQSLTDAEQLAAWNDYVPRHLLPRLHAYELMMAPYAIAHLKVGLKLAETGYRFDTEERARIYLTNALEPWQRQLKLPDFEALAHEAAAVNEIKRHQRFTIVVGNPPYSRASGNRGDFAEELVAGYKAAVRGERNVQPLSDDYIKFIAFGQYQLQRSSIGVVAMITNNTYLSGRIHRGIRKALLDDNDICQVLDLHGSGTVRFLGERGAGDENVFDILQGVAIAAYARGLASALPSHAEIVGSRSEKYEGLTRNAIAFSEIQPNEPYFLLVPREGGVDEDFACFTSLTEVFGFCNVAGKPGDDHLLVHFSSDEVIPILRAALSSPPQPGERTTEARRKLTTLDPDHEFALAAVSTYAYRPFDTRYVYYDPAIWTRAVEPLQRCVDGSPILLSTKIVKDSRFSHVFVTRQFPDVISLSNTSSVNCYAFPQRRPRSGLFALDGDDTLESNMTLDDFRAVCGASVSSQEVFAYIYAVLHSPRYRLRYYEPLQLDFPRVPLPTTLSLFVEVSSLGQSLIDLHLLESPALENSQVAYSGPAHPVVGRVGWCDDAVWLDAPAGRRGQAARTGTFGFRVVPEAVWDFHIGGYQVCHKWLKDRKGRTLSDDDIAHYQKIVVAISETIRIMAEIDEVIEEHGGWPGAFVTSAGGAEA